MMPAACGLGGRAKEARVLSVLPIRKYPDPVLLSRCEAVEELDAELRDLAESMIETMYSAQGIGLAANQVGESRRLLVVDVSGGSRPGQRIVAVNPEILEEKGAESGEEGCLSIPGIVAMVERPTWIRIRWRDLEGESVEREAEGLLARALCHEVDHLEGRTILDHVSSLKRSLLKKKIRKSVRAGEWGG